jgi:hypothetical protein
MLIRQIKCILSISIILCLKLSCVSLLSVRENLTTSMTILTYVRFVLKNVCTYFRCVLQTYHLHAKRRPEFTHILLLFTRPVICFP